jgi:hypothetical protein
MVDEFRNESSPTFAQYRILTLVKPAFAGAGLAKLSLRTSLHLLAS